MIRNGTTKVVMVNNIVAGNYYYKPGVASDPANTDRYDLPAKSKYILEMQAQSVDLNEIGASDTDFIVENNVLGGNDKTKFIGRAGSDSARDAAQAACTFVPNSKFKTIFRDSSIGDYRPSGPALTAGKYTETVSTLLGKYNTDLAGNPRTSNGTIAAG